MCAVHTGPMSSAHTTIEPDSGRNWKVKYMPTEVGVYNINLAWNDVEVDGKSLSSLEKYHQALSCDGNRHCVILAHSVKHPGDCSLNALGVGTLWPMCYYEHTSLWLARNA